MTKIFQQSTRNRAKSPSAPATDVAVNTTGAGQGAGLTKIDPKARPASLCNQLTVELVPLGELQLPKRALRVHPEQQILKLGSNIAQFGFLVPILIGADRELICGGARIEAARRLGIETVPAIRVEHLTANQIRAFRIADNRLAELSEWDEQAIAIELKELSSLELDFSLEITGFDTAEIDLRIDSLDNAAGHDPADEVPARAPEAVSRPGDLWVLGDHRLICGDALAAETYRAVMSSDKARMVFADPPYNVPIAGHVSGLGRHQHREFAMASGEMTEAQFTAFLAQVLVRMAENSIDGGLLYVCMDWRHLHELGIAQRHANLDQINLCVWAKANGGMGSLYRSRHEIIYVLKNGTAPHLNNVQLGRFGRYRTNLWEYAGVNSFGRHRDEELALHPTVKPVALVADAIRDCSRRGEIVLDPFCGSGTTIIAAERTRRRARCIELDPLYADVAVRRWQKLTGKMAVHATFDIDFDAMARQRSSAPPTAAGTPSPSRQPSPPVRIRTRPAAALGRKPSR